MYDPRFDSIWELLAERGKCDAIGGAEYWRVKDEWEMAGRRMGIALFILAHVDTRNVRNRVLPEHDIGGEG